MMNVISNLIKKGETIFNTFGVKSNKSIKNTAAAAWIEMPQLLHCYPGKKNQLPCLIHELLFWRRGWEGGRDSGCILTVGMVLQTSLVQQMMAVDTLKVPPKLMMVGTWLRNWRPHSS